MFKITVSRRKQGNPDPDEYEQSIYLDEQWIGYIDPESGTAYIGFEELGEVAGEQVKKALRGRGYKHVAYDK